MPDESQSHSATHNFLNPSLNYSGTKTRVRFSGSCLKQDKITYTHRKIAEIYIVYEINKKRQHKQWSSTRKCWFGAVSLTKNADIDNYKYSGYGIDLVDMYFFLILVVELVEML